MTPPQATHAAFQHVVDTYVSETSKTAAVWQLFSAADLEYRPHPKSSTVAEQLKHQLLSERRFFAEFLGLPELPAAQILPDVSTPEMYAKRLTQLAARRLAFLASQTEEWWLQPVRFFDVTPGAHLDLLAAGVAFGAPSHPIDGLSKDDG